MTTAKKSEIFTSPKSSSLSLLLSSPNLSYSSSSSSSNSPLEKLKTNPPSYRADIMLEEKYLGFPMEKSKDDGGKRYKIDEPYKQNHYNTTTTTNNNQNCSNINNTSGTNTLTNNNSINNSTNSAFKQSSITPETKPEQHKETYKQQNKAFSPHEISSLQQNMIQRQQQHILLQNFLQQKNPFNHLQSPLLQHKQHPKDKNSSPNDKLKHENLLQHPQMLYYQHQKNLPWIKAYNNNNNDKSNVGYFFPLLLYKWKPIYLFVLFRVLLISDAQLYVSEVQNQSRHRLSSKFPSFEIE